MPTNVTIALPEDLATQAEKYAEGKGMTLEELIIFLCKEACDAQETQKDA